MFLLSFKIDGFFNVFPAYYTGTPFSIIDSFILSERYFMYTIPSGSDAVDFTLIRSERSSLYIIIFINFNFKNMGRL